MRLQDQVPSSMVELAMPKAGYTVQHLTPTSYEYDLACAMLASSWLTAMVMLAGFAMFLYYIREKQNV